MSGFQISEVRILGFGFPGGNPRKATHAHFTVCALCWKGLVVAGFIAQHVKHVETWCFRTSRFKVLSLSGFRGWELKKFRN